MEWRSCARSILSLARAPRANSGLLDLDTAHSDTARRTATAYSPALLPMDQDSFRELLHKPSASSSTNSSTHVRGSLLPTAATASAGKKKAKTANASQPAFKPRTLKKIAKGETYRDRAAERRLGTNNDYAQVRVSFHFSGSLQVQARLKRNVGVALFRSCVLAHRVSSPIGCFLTGFVLFAGRGSGGGLRASECRECRS